MITQDPPLPPSVEMKQAETQPPVDPKQAEAHQAEAKKVETKTPETQQFIRPKWCALWVWQVFIMVAGVATILVGIVLLPAPGPGSLVIYAGLGILATEFVWAKRWFILIGRWAKQLIMRVRVWVKQMWRREKP